MLNTLEHEFIINKDITSILTMIDKASEYHKEMLSKEYDLTDVQLEYESRKNAISEVLHCYFNRHDLFTECEQVLLKQLTDTEY